MSRNILKYNLVVQHDNDARIIDSNVLLEQKLRLIRESMSQNETEQRYQAEEGFAEGLNASQVEALLGENPIIKAEPVPVGPTREEMIEEAQAEIDIMLEQARADAEQMKQSAYEEGHQEGYSAGHQEGVSQAEAMKIELREKEKRLEAEYADKLDETEPMLIDTLTGIYEHIFHVELEGFREAIVCIINDVITNTEGNKDFIIRVSQKDYTFVSGQKEQIKKNTVGNSTVEIIEDMTLADGDCLIETGGGIFDCGIDTQLAELGKELKLLSYEKKN